MIKYLKSTDKVENPLNPLNLTKLEEKSLHRIKFPSTTQAKKFVYFLLQLGYTKLAGRSISEIGRGEAALLIFNKGLIGTKEFLDEAVPHTEYLVTPPKKISGPLGKSVQHTLMYMKKDIHGTDDLELRYYCHFKNRPDYEGKYFVRNKAKMYLEITKKEAEYILSNFETPDWERVVGFNTISGYIKCVFDKIGNLIRTENK